MTCVAVTTNLRLAEAPGNVLLPEGSGGLDADSVANVSQVVTLDKSWLTERIGALGHQLSSRVDDGLRRALDLR